MVIMVIEYCPDVLFEWDREKDLANQKKHGVSFSLAKQAFIDPKRVVTKDTEPSREEERFLCIGLVGSEVITVRFTYRGNIIRIFGAGNWRKGRRYYEKENQIYG